MYLAVDNTRLLKVTSLWIVLRHDPAVVAPERAGLPMKNPAPKYVNLQTSSRTAVSPGSSRRVVSLERADIQNSNTLLKAGLNYRHTPRSRTNRTETGNRSHVI